MLSRELKLQKTNMQEKTFWPEVHEISPVSIYGEVYGAKEFRKRYV